MGLSGKAIPTFIIVAVVIMAVLAYAVLGTATGTVTVYVEDSPDDWRYVNVTFSEVQIHRASAGNDSGWYTLPITNGTIDLVTLTNASALLASAGVPEGMYTQIRIVVSTATGVMVNGTQVTFAVPSGELKTTHPFNVTEGHTERITLDIDLEHSIAHNSQGWVFKPVMGSISSESDWGT